MQKRGQIYLLAALLIGFILFTLAAQMNVVKKTVIEDDFEELSKNYERESARFVNDLLDKGTTSNLGDDFAKFTILFTSFSKTKNPEFGLIYAFLYDDVVYVGNYLDEDVVLTSYSPPVSLKGCYKNVKASVSIAGLSLQPGSISLGTFTSCKLATTPPPGNRLMVEVDGIAYEISLTPNNPEIMIVSRENIAEQRKVFLKGNFIKGRRV
jgi:hypothetical protein